MPMEYFVVVCSYLDGSVLRADKPGLWFDPRNDVEFFGLTIIEFHLSTIQLWQE